MALTYTVFYIIKCKCHAPWCIKKNNAFRIPNVMILPPYYTTQGPASVHDRCFHSSVNVAVSDASSPRRGERDRASAAAAGAANHSEGGSSTEPPYSSWANCWKSTVDTAKYYIKYYNVICNIYILYQIIVIIISIIINPLSLLLKHPPNGKHGDLSLLLGGYFVLGCP